MRMFTLKDVSHYLIKNKNILWSASICSVAVLITIFILNTVLGLLVHYVDPLESIFWHFLSPFCVGLLLTVILSCLLCAVFCASG